MAAPRAWAAAAAWSASCNGGAAQRRARSAAGRRGSGATDAMHPAAHAAANAGARSSTGGASAGPRSGLSRGRRQRRLARRRRSLPPALPAPTAPPAHPPSVWRVGEQHLEPGALAVVQGHLMQVLYRQRRGRGTVELDVGHPCNRAGRRRGGVRGLAAAEGGAARTGPCSPPRALLPAPWALQRGWQGPGAHPAPAAAPHVGLEEGAPTARTGAQRGLQAPLVPIPAAMGRQRPQARPSGSQGPCPRPSPFSRKYLTNCTLPNCSNTLRRNSACAEGRGALSEGGAASCEPPAPATHACAAPRHHKQPAIGRLVYAERHGGRKE